MLLRTVPMLLLLASIAPAAPLPSPRDVEPVFRDFRSLGRLTPWGNVIGTTPDGRRLVMRGHSTFLFVLDLTSGKVLHELHTRESIQDAAISPDGTLLATAEWRDGVKVRKLDTLELVDTAKGGEGLAASQVRFTGAQRLGVHSWWGNKSQVWAYDLDTRKETSWPAVERADTDTIMVREWMLGRGPFLVAIERGRAERGGLYNSHRLWLTDPATGKSTPPLTLGKHDYFHFDVRHDGRQAIVMQPGEDPRVIDVATGKTVRTLDGHDRWVAAAAFSPNGKLIATASARQEDGHARCYTMKYPRPAATPEILVRNAAGKVIGKLKDDEKRYDVARVGFAANGQYLWALTHEQEVLIWGNLPPISTKLAPLPDGGLAELLKKRKN